MSEQNIPEQLEALRQQIRLYDYHYYALDEPLVPDSAYDACFRALEALEAQHPALITADSPTQRVGLSPVSALEPITHRQPMLSLSNVLSDEEAHAFFKRVAERSER